MLGPLSQKGRVEGLHTADEMPRREVVIVDVDRETLSLQYSLPPYISP